MAIEAAIVGKPVAPSKPTEPTTDLLFVGRGAELERFDRLAVAALDGHGGVIEIIGEGGIGKSRLVREALTRRQTLTRVPLRGGQYAKNTPYFVVRTLLRETMAIDPSQSPVEAGARLTDWVREHAPVLTPWLPLLALVVGAEVDPTIEVDRLADEFRGERLLDAAADAIDGSLSGPTALIAEDIHLFDLESGRSLAAAERAGSGPAPVAVS